MNEEERAFQLAQIAAHFCRRKGTDMADALRTAQELLDLASGDVKRQGNRAKLDTARESGDLILEVTELEAGVQKMGRKSKPVRLDAALKDLTAACSARGTADRRERFIEVFGADLLAHFEERCEVPGVAVVFLATKFSIRWKRLKRDKARKNSRKPRA